MPVMPVMPATPTANFGWGGWLRIALDLRDLLLRIGIFPKWVANLLGLGSSPLGGELNFLVEGCHPTTVPVPVLVRHSLNYKTSKAIPTYLGR